MINKYSKTGIIGMFIFMLSIGCCPDGDCPCSNEEVSEFQCAPREGTITQFNAGLEDDPEVITDPQYTVNYTPVPEYSIHTFEFPFNPLSSGSLPNDQRFTANNGIQYIPIATLPVDDFGIDANLSYAVIDSKPSNNLMNGDLLVDSIHIESGQDPYAFIKVRGSFTGVSERINPSVDAPPQFLSESSADMCEYMQSNIDDDNIDILGLRENLSEYGEDAVDGNNNSIAVIENYFLAQNENSVVLNSRGQIVVDENGNINPYTVVPDSKFETELENIRGALIANFSEARNKLNELLNNKNIRSVSLRVQIGDVFFYRAKNGRDFLVTVVNIDERDFGQAYKKRLSIMFNEI